MGAKGDVEWSRQRSREAAEPQPQSPRVGTDKGFWVETNWISEMQNPCSCNPPIFAGTLLACRQVSGDFVTLVDALKLLDLKLAWSLQWYGLVELNSPVSDPRPCIVPVKALPRQPEHFWPPKRKQRAPRQQAPMSWEEEWSLVRAEPGPDVALDEASADDDEDMGDEEEEDEEPEPLADSFLGEELVERSLLALLEEGPEEVSAPFLEEEAAVLQEPLPADTGGGAEAFEEVPEVALGPLEEEGRAPLEVGQLQAEPVARVLVAPRMPAECSVTIPGLGRIAYHQTKLAFEAHCQCGHGRCVLSRTSQGPAQGQPTGRGRPLGFLMCWLQSGTDCADKARHWNKEAWRATFTQEARLAGRVVLQSFEGAEGLFAAERMLGDGEPEEHESLQGLL